MAELDQRTALQLRDAVRARQTAEDRFRRGTQQTVVKYGTEYIEACQKVNELFTRATKGKR